MKNDYDVVIVGGGVVGLAVAMRTLELKSDTRLLLLEKEDALAMHQSGNNSGVIHSGLYYKSNSLKAKNCINGYQQLLEFCDKESVPYEICGKIVVATNKEELPRLADLYQRGMSNGLKGLRMLSSEEIREFEPNCAGILGLHVPQTGIVNYHTLAQKFSDSIKRLGGEIRCGSRVNSIKSVVNGAELNASGQIISCKQVVTCCGLQSDRMAMFTNPNLDLRIIPFRGEYYELSSSAKGMVKNLIYPVPDPNFPFLGVHFTKMIDGGVECGPNAVLAFAREGYKKTDFNLQDMMEILNWPGFYKIARKYWRTGLEEFYRSYNKAAFLQALQRLVPGIEMNDLIPCGAGVRAQACDRNGNLLDDFYVKNEGVTIHVCNAPSPAATSSLSIGGDIANALCQKLTLQ
ncbi:MAG: L-2-hydroxyglutarate oxidase [Gallionellaceae bacterium]|jgi:L-2-hydroxyglutarate oxidase